MTAPRQLQLPNWLDAASRSHPNRLALAFGSDRWTFAELRRSVAAAAAVLTSARGDKVGRIGILAANRPGFVFAVHAATRLAVPFVPINWRQSSDEIAWQLQDAGITVLVVDEERLAVAETACAGLPVTIVPIGALEQAPAPFSHQNDAPRIELDREAAIIFTSGTSGRPKGARITYGNLWFSAVASALYLGHHADDVWLATMPLFHVGGLSILFRGIIGVTPIVLHDQFDPEKMLAAIDEGATLVSVVPVMLQRMIDARGDASWPRSLRRVLLGGSSAPPRLIEECLRLGIPVAPTYGLTEATSQVATLLPAQAPAKPSSSGLPLPLTEVRVVAPIGVAAPGEIGQIEIRGPTVFAGYLGDGDIQSATASSERRVIPRNEESRHQLAYGRGATRFFANAQNDTDSAIRSKWIGTENWRVPLSSGYRGRRRRRPYGHAPGGKPPTVNVHPLRTVDGWFQTGDAGYLDDDGYLYVVDRRDDLIISGGENVYPAEIERVLLEHRSVIDAGVIGVADETWGSRPVAAVVWQGDPEKANADLLRHCAERLSSYKVPDRMLLFAELPRSPSGKLLRRDLREQIADMQERAATAS